MTCAFVQAAAELSKVEQEEKEFRHDLLGDRFEAPGCALFASLLTFAASQ